MNNYFLKDGTREKGPFLIDDLKYQRIRPDTLVKIDEGKWQPISEVRELRFLLKVNDGGNAYSSAAKSSNTSSYSNPQQNSMSAEQQIKRRVVISIAIAIAFAVVGLAASLFFTTASR